MTVKAKLLAYLLDHPGHFHTGPELADHFQVSRNAVWKAVKQLETEGYEIIRHPKNGYALENLNHAIDPSQISHGLQNVWPELKVYYQESTSSTNDLGRKHAADHPNQPALFISNEQTAGRGRRGRAFYSSLSQGLYFSLVMAPPKGVNNDLVASMTIASASAYAETLSSYLSDDVMIKWVNDLFYQGKKVVGILTEATFDMESQTISHLVLGVGSNLAGDFSKENAENQSVAGTLFGPQLPRTFNTNDLITNFVIKFKSYYDDLSSLAFLDYYRSHLLGKNQWVNYTENHENYRGKILGVTDLGHLSIETPEGKVRTLVSGEVSFSSQQFADQ